MMPRRNGVPRIGLPLAAITLSLLAASCSGGGGPEPAPTDVTASPGDGRVVLKWTPRAGIEYWVFGSTDAAITTSNWVDLANPLALTNAESPQPVCALQNGRTFYLTVNARSGSGEGGPGSAAVAASVRAAGSSWTAGTAVPGAVNGIGFALSTDCKAINTLNTARRPATGRFIAVGPGATIYSSVDDGASWVVHTAAAGFTADLHAVDTYTARPNDRNNLEQTMIAVGVGLGAVYSKDGGTTWQVGSAPATAQTLRAITHNGARFVAVGDGGRIRFTENATLWFDRVSPTTNDLHDVVFAVGYFMAVGKNGTLLRAISDTSWDVLASGTSADLHGVAYGNNNANLTVVNEVERLINTWVVVGANGTVLTSTDGGATWTGQTLAGNPNLIKVGYSTRFVALDDTGNSWVSDDGATWTGPNPTGVANPVGMAASGYGYIGFDASGATAQSF